jgi:hypothetical protein
VRWLRRGRKVEPRPPANVRVEYPDGRVVPLECVYLGDRGGLHTWAAVLVVEAEDGMRLCCDALPPRTGVVVAAGRRVGEDWP